MRTIFHIDMDSFFSSVEARLNPDLVGKPVIIGADPKIGRGVVSTCSYEARKWGIHSAMPISKAYRILPNAVYLRPNYFLYKTVSNRIMEILRSYGANFSQVGIDEAYIEFLKMNKEESIKTAKQIRKEIMDKEGLTCSIGIAANKITAKVASDFKKPNGLTYVDNPKVFLGPLNVRKIPGIGKKTESLLNEMGIKTVSDMSKAKLRLLKFGNYGLRLFLIANGIDDSPFTRKPKSSSISREETFSADIDDVKQLTEEIERLCEQAHISLRKHRLSFKTVGIKIRFFDFTTFSRAKSVEAYSSDLLLIKKIAKKLMEEFGESKKNIRLTGVRLSNLKKDDLKQKSVLDYC